jgi:hypothetical protein
LLQGGAESTLDDRIRHGHQRLEDSPPQEGEGRAAHSQPRVRFRRVRERSWALRVELDDLPEVTFASAHEYGLESAELVSDDPSRCRELALQLRENGMPGIVVSSAALPGTRNVVLFGPRVGSPYLFEPLGPVDIPASITAHAGRPMVSLLDLVRFHGDPHPGLDAWQRDDELAFDEPDWELVHETRDQPSAAPDLGEPDVGHDVAVAVANPASSWVQSRAASRSTGTYSTS